MELIRLKGVSKNYKKNKILRDVNLMVEAGDVLGVIGQSGSGKTTLLNLLVGFIEPTDGEVVYYSKVEGKEKDLNDNLHKIKRHFGFTPQHNSFYPKLTVKENLIHFGKLYKIDKKTLENNITSLLEFTKLSQHHNKLAEHLSGGMQKRLDISCSLVHKPKILVLDEPTADLDPILQKEILHLLEEVNKQGISIIIASHQLEHIEKICNKVAIVHKGRVQSHGLIEDIKKPFLKDHFTINVHSGKEKAHILEKLKGLHFKKIIDKNHKLIIYPEHIKDTMEGLLNIIKDEGLNFYDMDVRKPTLNEVFEKIALDDQPEEE
ncbi:ABC transporter ATP-binding protein [Candidatus Woesearchaeota archaeon]|jgi:ABC-2 type transport system ATP-binding protein|nr:ABC transporter ATP-binding protein [Candidatus Woesearchaeota archaeon]